MCKASQYEEAIEVFQTALAKGTSDPDLRAAVFSQIGNAYFYLRVSHKVREIHYDLYSMSHIPMYYEVYCMIQVYSMNHFVVKVD